MATVANKVQADAAHDPYVVERTIASNKNVQMLTLGSQIVGPAVAKKPNGVWLNGEFQGRHSAP